MADTILAVVDVAKTFKDFISCSSVDFDPLSLKDKILTSDNDKFLRVRKNIGSAITIVSVDNVTDDYATKAILG